MKIFGVEILNEGSGISIDDAVTEMQATFVASYVEPMDKSSRKHAACGFKPGTSWREPKNLLARARAEALPSCHAPLTSGVCFTVS